MEKPRKIYNYYFDFVSWRTWIIREHYTLLFLDENLHDIDNGKLSKIFSWIEFTYQK
jgi:hypothetical protein